VLAKLAEAMSPDRFTDCLDRSLEILRDAVGADDAEIFLVEPDTGALVLTACRGLDRRALLSRDRFEPGMGHPGIVTKTRRRLVTRSLACDRRFLRDEVKRRGVRAYVSVPLATQDLVVGSIHLGWRRSDVEVERICALLRRAAIPIATTIRAAVASVRDVALTVDNEPSACALRSVLTSIEQLTKADAVMIKTDGAVVSTSAAAACTGDLASCPSLRAGAPIFHDGPQSSWPLPCRGAPATKARCCLPLVARNERRGVITLVHDKHVPTIRTQHLASLTALARTIAPRLPTLVQGQAQAGPSLRIRCFGALDIRRDDRPIPASSFERRHAVRLLEMLVLAGGASLHRDALVERLWPDSSGDGGPNRLHSVVHALRVAIEPDAPRWRFVHNAGPLYRLELSDVWTDLSEFRRRLARALRDPSDSREARVADLEAAVALYRGELFAEDPYADWCSIERAALQEEFLTAVTTLAKHLTESRELDRSIDVLRAGLRADPLREDLHVMLTKNLLDTGRRGEASAQYEECVRVLRRGLGAEPLPETRALESTIRKALRPV
jgi:DNA-binding SARP family transcriptional activator/GAF domain-containing protein